MPLAVEELVETGWLELTKIGLNINWVGIEALGQVPEAEAGRSLERGTLGALGRGHLGQQRGCRHCTGRLSCLVRELSYHQVWMSTPTHLSKMTVRAKPPKP